MLRYVDTAFERLPIDGGGTMLWSSNWVPFIWSIRDVCGVEVAHTALANWQAGRTEQAYELWRGSDPRFDVRLPGTGGVHRHVGAARPHGGPVHRFRRHGGDVLPHARRGAVRHRAGCAWRRAADPAGLAVGRGNPRRSTRPRSAIRTRARAARRRSTSGAKFRRPMRLRLRIAARGVRVAEVTVNGQPVAVEVPAQRRRAGDRSRGRPSRRRQGRRPLGRASAGPGGRSCHRRPGGERSGSASGPPSCCEVLDPQKRLKDVRQEASAFSATATGQTWPPHGVRAAGAGDLSWWSARVVSRSARAGNRGGKRGLGEQRRCSSPCRTTRASRWRPKRPWPVRHLSKRSVWKSRRMPHLPPCACPLKVLLPGTNPITIQRQGGDAIRGAVVDWRKCDESLTKSCECVDLSKAFNDRVTEIFKHEYRSPRSPYCSLQIPLARLRRLVLWRQVAAGDRRCQAAGRSGAGGPVRQPAGDSRLPRRGPASSRTSCSPRGGTISRRRPTFRSAGRARHAWFLVPARRIRCTRSWTTARSSSRTPTERAERLAAAQPDHLVAHRGRLPDGHRRLLHPRPAIRRGSTWARAEPRCWTCRSIPSRELRSLTVRCLANEVVVGLMSVTVLRP